MTTPDLPPGLPPLPPVPEGFDCLVYRGTEFMPDYHGADPYFVLYEQDVGKPDARWFDYEENRTAGWNGCHYLEAVREPAKDETCPKCGAERIYYDGWNCPTEGCDVDDWDDEPAKDRPASGEAETPHWQILRHIAQGLDDQGKPGYAADIRDAADAFEDIAKPSTAPEARVCEDIGPFAWCAVLIKTGEPDKMTIQPFDDELTGLVKGWEWRRFRLVEAPLPQPPEGGPEKP